MTDRGSATPMVAVLVLGGALLLGVTVDLGRIAAVHAEARRAARAGAEAGAAVIDVEATYRGRVVVDTIRAPETARRAALASRPRPGRTATATADHETVCVRVRQPFEPGPARIAGADRIFVSATACASPQSG